MQYNDQEVTLAFENLKSASLFYDFVIPWFYVPNDITDLTASQKLFSSPYMSDLDLISSLRKLDTSENESILLKIMPPELTDGNVINENYIKYNKEVTRFVFHNADMWWPDSKNDNTTKNINYSTKELKYYYEKSFSPLFANTNYLRSSFGDIPTVLNKIESSEIHTVAFELSNLEYIDTSLLSWADILEIRKDKDRLKKLINLRRMFYEKYENKQSDYIKSELSKKIDNYNKTLKDIGVKTVLSTFKTTLATGFPIPWILELINRDELLNMLKTSEACILFIAANVSIGITKSIFSKFKITSESDISYLAKIKKIEQKNA